jgi:hypothetical protein
MRIPTRQSPKGIPPLLGIPTTATATTTRPPSLTYLRPTSPPRLQLTAGRNLLRRRRLRLRNATSQHCIVRNMRRPQRSPPSRHNTNRLTRQVMVPSSTRAQDMPAMVSRPHRARMCRILYIPRFLWVPTTRLTRILSPTGCLDLARSRRRCHPLRAALMPLLKSPDTRRTRHFPVARWTTCQRSQTGESMVAAKMISKSRKIP